MLSNHYGGQGLEGQRHQVADGSEGGATEVRGGYSELTMIDQFC